MPYLIGFNCSEGVKESIWQARAMNFYGEYLLPCGKGSFGVNSAFMSLNRYEQMLFDYVENRAEEKLFWEARVADVWRREKNSEQGVLDLNAQLWEYFEERSRYESPFREVVQREGAAKISMLNLSEYLLRMWTASTP